MCTVAAELRLSAAERLVWLALRFHQAEKPNCWPSWPTLAEETGISQRWVATIIGKLERLGLVQIERERGKVNAYIVRSTPELSAGVGYLQPLNSVQDTPELKRTKPLNSVHPNKEGIKKEKRRFAPRMGFDSPRVATEPPSVSADEVEAVAVGLAGLLGRKGAKPNGGAHLSAADQAKCRADPIAFWAEQERLAVAKSEAGR
jgi:hypothetical protein